MSPALSSPNRVVAGRVALYILRGLVVLWALFWLWFIAAVLISEQSLEGLKYGGGVAAAIIVAAGAACLFPPVGGALLIAGGAVAAWYFNGAAARTMLAAPAIVLGLGFLLSSLVRRRAASATE